jgi:hypothetical protein
MENQILSAIKKSLVVFSSVVLLPICSYGFVMDDCVVGKTVYIDDWYDEEVVIKQCDYSDNTIKVKDLRGNSKWVKPSELMGAFAREVENAGENMLIEFVAKALSNHSN